MDKGTLEAVTAENQARLAQAYAMGNAGVRPDANKRADTEDLSNGGGERKPDRMDHELVDTKIKLSEAKTDLKFQELTSKVDALTTQLSTVARSLADDMARVRSDNQEMRSTVRNWGLSVAALVVAVPGVIAKILFGAPDFAEKHQPIAATPAPIVIQAQPAALLPAPNVSPTLGR